MTKKIDLFDPTSWAQFDWDEKEVHPDLKKTDRQLDRKRINTLRNQSPAMREAAARSNQRRKGENHPLFGVRGEDCYAYGYKHTEEDKLKMSHPGEKNGMYGVKLTGELNHMYGETHTDEVKQRLKKAALNRQPDHHCEYCNGDFTAQSYKQHHGDNCAKNPNRIVKIHKKMIRQTCPHCGKETPPKAFIRLHGDNCKHKR